MGAVRFSPWLTRIILILVYISATMSNGGRREGWRYAAINWNGVIAALHC
jgi:hypothetical protein